MEKRKKLGVLGGMGPMATAYFMELAVEMTDAQKDNDHIEMNIYNVPVIPDRTDYILNKSNLSPVPQMKEILNMLNMWGADLIAIPCNTAFCFYEDLNKVSENKIIHCIQETVKYLKEREVKSVGIMATDGTIQTRLFQDELLRCNITPVCPDDKMQALIMKFIYENVKAGKKVSMEEFNLVSDSLRRKGAEVIILGCTELSVIKKESSLGPGFLDTLEILAACAVRGCAQLKEEYEELITK